MRGGDYLTQRRKEKKEAEEKRGKPEGEARRGRRGTAPCALILDEASIATTSRGSLKLLVVVFLWENANNNHSKGDFSF